MDKKLLTVKASRKSNRTTVTGHPEKAGLDLVMHSMNVSLALSLVKLVQERGLWDPLEPIWTREWLSSLDDNVLKNIHVMLHEVLYVPPKR